MVSYSSQSLTVTVPPTHNRSGDYARSLASDSLGDILKIIHLVIEKSQRSVTHDFLHYINILTYLLTYLRVQVSVSELERFN